MSSESNLKTGSEAHFGIRSDGILARWYGIFQAALKGIVSCNLQHMLILFTMGIGAFALSATQFAGEGALRLLWEDLDHLMGNRVIVYPDPGSNQILLNRRPTADLTLEDFHQLQKGLTDVRYVSPAFFKRGLAATKKNRVFMTIEGITGIMASEPVYLPILGTGFSHAARQGFVRECMLTQSAAQELGVDLKKRPFVMFENRRLRVTGIIVDPPETDERFQKRIVVPFILTQLLWGKPNVVDHIVVAWNHSDAMESTINRLQAILNACRAPGAYYLSSTNFEMKKRRNIVSNFMAFGNAQALFCILIASIGVVNVMLANVIRRMREFAIRVAMGAKQRDIMYIILLESTLLGLMGAAFGTVVAIVTAGPICSLISSRIPEASQLVPYVGLEGIVLPLLVCTTSSLLAGILPAIRALRFDILTFLRNE